MGDRSRVAPVFGDEVARRFVKRGVAQLAAVWKKYRERYEDRERV